MTGLDVALAVAGLGVTLLVVVGMILLTPPGAVGVHAEGTDAEGSNLSPLRGSAEQHAPVPVGAVAAHAARVPTISEKPIAR